MKKLISIISFLVFLLNFESSFSQDWRSIRVNGVFMFRNDNYINEFFAYRIDSILTSGNDTIYKSFPVIKQLDWNCFSPDDGSWIGKKTIISPNGENIFINYQNDSIRINTYANINDSWVMCNTGNVIATVITIKDTTFLGLNDSIKIIGLASTISNINGKKITLSKHYGLIRMPDFYDFPNNPFGNGQIQFSLAGMSNPEVGVQNLTLKEIYTYDVGDEFHRYSLYKTDWFYQPYHEEEIWSIYNVIDTLHSITTDTLKYLFKRCQKIRYHYYSFDTSYQTFTTFNDTVVVKHILNNSEEFDFDHLPNEPIINSYDLSAYQLTIHPSGITGKIAPSEYDILNYNPPCWVFPTLDACSGSRKYYKGIYGNDYFCSYFNAQINSSLLYYRKGTQAWGTPYDCGTILSIEFDEQFALNKITIAPNPASGYFNIIIDRYTPINMTLELFNIYGNMIRQEEINGQFTVVSCKELSSGIYLYRVHNGSNLIVTGKLVVQ